MFRQMKKEKESWIEKLIELLNEYGIDGDHWSKEENLYSEENSLLIISKSYWFIKWLVENEKIDMKKHFYDKMSCVWYSDLNIVLCELAIQDEPIEFLISILK